MLLSKKTCIKLFKLTGSTLHGIHKCHACDIINEPIIKMGGLICTKCRVIIAYPGDEDFKRRLAYERRKDAAK